MPDKIIPLYLVDAYGLIYRSYFAFMNRPPRNSMGRSVSALFGFARTVVGLLNDGAPVRPANDQKTLQTPLRLAVVFDSRTPTFRHQKYPEYKSLFKLWFFAVSRPRKFRFSGSANLRLDRVCRVEFWRLQRQNFRF